MTIDESEFVFAPLGGLGEIGMNAALYGFGPARRAQMDDGGLRPHLSRGPILPGVDLVLPDVSFVEKIGRDLLGLLITHAHEDHIGAIAALWPKLRCRVFATRFAAGLHRNASPRRSPARPMSRSRGSGRERCWTLVPSASNMSPSLIPFRKPARLAIRTPAGLVVHTGDWKIDPDPGVGYRIDEARLRALGDEGVTALICNSTNILREGDSFSESDVARTLRALIGEAAGRVLVTTFASNISRVRAIAEAAQACGRSVVVAGRAMERAIQVARECGYLEGIAGFYSLDISRRCRATKSWSSRPAARAKRAPAMARIARGEHPAIKLVSGDRVIFSSRTIPGNVREVNRVINKLCDLGVEVITDHDHLVHCSGHPRRRRGGAAV